MREIENREKPLLTSPKGRDKKRVESMLERHPELDSGSHATTTVVSVDRFRVEPGMTVRAKSRVTGTGKESIKSKQQSLSTIKYDNSIRQRTDNNYKTIYLS